MDIKELEQYKPLIRQMLKCWKYECGNDCPFYDYSPDRGFRCERYKSMDRVEEFINIIFEKDNQ